MVVSFVEMYLRPFHLIKDGVTVVEEYLAILLLVGLSNHHSANARQVGLESCEKVGCGIFTLKYVKYEFFQFE